jgi:hypothetical protein
MVAVTDGTAVTAGDMVGGRAVGVAGVKKLQASVRARRRGERRRMEGDFSTGRD